VTQQKKKKEPKIGKKRRSNHKDLINTKLGLHRDRKSKIEKGEGSPNQTNRKKKDTTFQGIFWRKVEERERR